ncbi:MAG: GNAT family N-acetyltransferase [Chloroflexi bacterium]|nr:GNAT family N-acetyltransferase [Chloroflexota bacterium]
MIAVLTDAEILDLVDENLAAFRRSLVGGRMDRSARGTTGHEDGYRTWTRGHVDGALERALPLAGFRPSVDLPVMILEGPPTPASGTSGTTVRRVADAIDRAALRSVVELADPGGAIDRAGIDMALDDDRWFDGAGNAAFMGFDERGVAAAAAMSFTHGPMTRIVWVGTAPAMRRLGHGAAVLGAAVQSGLAGGARLTVLESSPSGEPFYRALGFRTITRYRVWIAD